MKDPEKRAVYDQLGRRPAVEEFAPPPQWTQDFDAGGHGFEGVDLADLLAAMGRGRGEPGKPRAEQGRDYETSVRITLEAAHRGTTVNLDLADAAGGRTLEVTIPSGVREGQKLRLRTVGMSHPSA